MSATKPTRPELIHAWEMGWNAHKAFASCHPVAVLAMAESLGGIGVHEAAVLLDACAEIVQNKKENRGRDLREVRLLTWLADQFEEATRPPKPDEPLGLGAVIEDADGADWHRTAEGRWISGDGLCSRGSGWGGITAVRVLSEGVRP